MYNQNFKATIEGEHYENVEVPPKFADIAEEEGLPRIAARLRAIWRVESIMKKDETGNLEKR